MPCCWQDKSLGPHHWAWLEMTEGWDGGGLVDGFAQSRGRLSLSLIKGVLLLTACTHTHTTASLSLCHPLAVLGHCVRLKLTQAKTAVQPNPTFCLNGWAGPKLQVFLKMSHITSEFCLRCRLMFASSMFRVFFLEGLKIASPRCFLFILYFTR